MCGCFSSQPDAPSDAGDAGQACDADTQDCPLLGTLRVALIDDEDGKGIGAVDITITGPDGRSLPTGGDGRATFKGLHPGSYSAQHGSTCVSAASGNATVAAASTADIELRVKHTHAVITILSLSYSSHNVVENDTTGDYAAPEWQKGRAQADQAPVAYARNKAVAFSAQFKVDTPPCRPEVVEVKGQATFGPVALEWEGKVTVNPGDADVTVALTSKQPLANEIGCFDASDITWNANPAGIGWAAAGTSRNLVYVTLGDPVAPWPNYRTLLDISCRGAATKAKEDDFVTASFAPFRSKLGTGKGFKRLRDGTELSYYKQGAGTGAVYACHDILGTPDGTGRCGAWQELMLNMHRIHGVTSSKDVGVVPISAPLLIVKNCDFVGAGSKSAPFTHVGEVECVKKAGIPGQGKDNPQFTFGDHALVKHSTGIYDPSYGVGPIADLRTWEDGGIAGIGNGGPPFVVFPFAGDTHFLPQTCSPGFIVHKLAAGETLGVLATRFGVASATALYNHAYNQPLRTKRTTMAAVTAGDDVVVPRAIASKLTVLVLS